MTSVESVDPTMTDRMWSRITRELVDTGRPAALCGARAGAAGVSPAESRAILHAMLQAYPIGWVHPDTDYIASFPPLNGLPTQYRVTVRGEQKWFAQCGFEATSVTWLFPGERVRIDVSCLDCGDPLAVEMLDGRLTRVDPPTVVGHLNYGFGPSRGRTPYL